MARIPEYIAQISLLTCLTYLTVRDLYSLLIQYREDKRVTMAKLVEDHSLPMPNFTLCFALGLRTARSSPWGPIATQTITELRKLIDNDPTMSDPGRFNLTKALAVAVLLSVDNYLFHVITTSSGNSYVSYSFSLEDDVDDVLSDQYVFDFHDRFLAQEQRASDIELEAAKLLCTNLYSVPRSWEACTEVMMRTRAHILYPERICMPLNMSQIYDDDDKSRYNSVYIIPKYFREMNENETSWKYAGTLIADDMVPLIFNEFMQGSLASGKTCSVTIGSGMVNSWIRVVATINSMFKRFRNCQDSPSKAHCLVKCRATVVLNVCDCYPFSVRFLSPDYQNGQPIRYCSTNDYLNCWNRTYKEATKCVDTCERLCTQFVYSWSFINETLSRMLHLQFEASSYFYPSFEEIPKATTTDLIAQIGGIAGLYLGIDGVVICAVIIGIGKAVRQLGLAAAHRRNWKATFRRISGMKANAVSDTKKLEVTNDRIELLEKRLAELESLEIIKGRISRNQMTTFQ